MAALLQAEDARRIVFTFNGTDSLNLAIHGSLEGTGRHVVTSAAEHNSVLRPLAKLNAGRIEVSRVACNAIGVVDPDEIRRALRRDTKLVALTHASNVTGALQPVAEVGRIKCREHRTVPGRRGPKLGRNSALGARAASRSAGGART